MGLLFDSFWRAAAYCLHPRIVALSFLPLLLMGGLAAGLGYFYWAAAVAAMQAFLQSMTWLDGVWQWLQARGVGDFSSLVAPVLLLVFALPVVVVVALLIVGLWMTPAVVSFVALRRFPMLERKQGGTLLRGLAWMLGSTLLALGVLVLSMPLWLIPPLVLLLPPLIWGWLTYRVMVFDALAEHADTAERTAILQRHRMALLLMGVACGYLGAAPGIVWISGVVFAAAFMVLIPLAVWIYTLVFAFSSLWFAHFCLAALQQLRQECAAPTDATDVTPVAVQVLPAVTTTGAAGLP